MKRLKIYLSRVIFVLAMMTTQAQADWLYYFGEDAADYDEKGIPLNMTLDDMTISDELWNKISTALPEARDIRLVNPDYITDDDGANIYLKEDGEVFVTFLHEGAGYKNSIGYFTYTGSHPVSREDIDEVILFPNTSYSNHGGSVNGLHSGNRVSLGVHPAGTYIGFLVSADGWDGQHGVRHSLTSERNFYTVKGFNAETDSDLQAHTVLLHDDESDNIILGIEDINRSYSWCDQDFNDVVLMVNSNPVTAIDTSPLTSLPEPVDADQDGILDGNDDYPNDALRAFDSYYPALDRKGTLAFEDMWPKKGDYDFNDLVMSYQVSEVLNAQGTIKDITMDFEILARGAALASGFAIAFDGVADSAIESATLVIDEADPVDLVAQENQDRLVLKLFDNSFNYTPEMNGCTYFNTEKNCQAGVGSSFTLRVTFTAAQTRAALGSIPYNPYLMMTHNTSLEVHMVDYSPTLQVDSDKFGQQDDDSSVASSRYYKTEDNLPWALDIPYPWCYPAEYRSISSSYLSFASWAESGGSMDSDWYTRDYNGNRLYDCLQILE